MENKEQLRESILREIMLPQIPKNRYDAGEFGIAADSDRIQTKELQQAIDAVSGNGGGRLVIPRGTYRTGALRLKDKVELHLESEDTVLCFVNEDQERHYPVVFCHWEATPCYNYSPLIYACDAKDIALTGRGTLDGGADKDHWWNWHHQVENAWSEDRPDLQLPDRLLLRRMNAEGIPVKERVFGPGHYLRPNFVQPIRCERVLFQGFTLINSPMWQLNPVMCKSLTVDGVTMRSHGSNNDGCDPESCSGVHIVNCRFDTGDDCISLKSGRDRDGRLADRPCENVVIEANEFADGHGGVALGSEMSGGIRRVLAVNNRFSSPNLTYALRFKTNARRGGRVEDIVLADSVMDHVHGAAVHGTMLYEDGRNGSHLPVFRNITIENIVAHGGDYGIFLEAFDEVPITGLVLRNIKIDGVAKAMRGMNWKDPVVEAVEINQKLFPRPSSVRILGIPAENSLVNADAGGCGGPVRCRFLWEVSRDGAAWREAGEGEEFLVPPESAFVRVTAQDQRKNRETSRSYQVLPRQVEAGSRDYERGRLMCRGMLGRAQALPDEVPVTRELLAEMMMPLADAAGRRGTGEGACSPALQAAVGCQFLALKEGRDFAPEGLVTRQEMATVAMQACGVNYRNASSTMPVCADVEKVSNNYGTNVARALYFGFMELGEGDCFFPDRPVTLGEAVEVLNRVADFAGI
ncbi:MAG: glycoside hydrolase family 28 protein [Hungatella sp.]|nr:glycoside hydrolase family 28 protein [Hungatella sp.]